jgi:hypothetical protein
MDKEQVEDKLRRQGTVPLLRERMGDYDLYISEGYSSPPHLSAQRLGIKPEDFPGGMHVTFYWLGKDEKLHFGSPSFYCALRTNQTQRIADVKARARLDLDRYIRARNERVRQH